MFFLPDVWTHADLPARLGLTVAQTFPGVSARETGGCLRPRWDSSRRGYSNERRDEAGPLPAGSTWLMAAVQPLCNAKRMWPEIWHRHRMNFEVFLSTALPPPTPIVDCVVLAELLYAGFFSRKTGHCKRGMDIWTPTLNQEDFQMWKMGIVW